MTLCLIDNWPVCLTVVNFLLGGILLMGQKEEVGLVKDRVTVKAFLWLDVTTELVAKHLLKLKVFEDFNTLTFKMWKHGHLVAAVNFSVDDVLWCALKTLLLLQAQHQPSYHLDGSAFIYWGGQGINIPFGWQLTLSRHSNYIKENRFPAEIKSCLAS